MISVSMHPIYDPFAGCSNSKGRRFGGFGGLQKILTRPRRNWSSNPVFHHGEIRDALHQNIGRFRERDAERGGVKRLQR